MSCCKCRCLHCRCLASLPAWLLFPFGRDNLLVLRWTSILSTVSRRLCDYCWLSTFCSGPEMLTSLDLLRWLESRQGRFTVFSDGSIDPACSRLKKGRHRGDSCSCLCLPCRTCPLGDLDRLPLALIGCLSLQPRFWMKTRTMAAIPTVPPRKATFTGTLFMFCPDVGSEILNHFFSRQWNSHRA